MPSDETRTRDGVRRQLDGVSVYQIAAVMGITKTRVEQIEKRAIRSLWRCQVNPSSRRCAR